MFLLQSTDIEVQRAASAALGNLAVNSMFYLFILIVSFREHADFELAENKVAIVLLGGLAPLIRQMMSPNVEVQCNAVGCITNLATHEDNKAKIARSGALGPLTRLAKSKDMRVQRNATGALLNMTHSGTINRGSLVYESHVCLPTTYLRRQSTTIGECWSDTGSRFAFVFA